MSEIVILFLRKIRSKAITKVSKPFLFFFVSNFENKAYHIT